MILESIVVIGFAILLDLLFGDPKNRFHPTAWIGILIGTITTRMKNENSNLEKLGGIFIVLIPVCISIVVLLGLDFSIDLISVESLSILISIISGVVLFKMTIAIKGMERHALAVLDSIQKNDLTQARTNLSMIVKRNTKNLDKNHILSGTLESLSENIVDGITGPMFYFAIFGLPGNPISSSACFRFFVYPYLENILNLTSEKPIKAILKNNFKKKNNLTRFIKSKLNTTKNGKLQVELLPGQESFKINSFVKSNIWAVLPSGQSKFKKGQIIDCFFPNFSNKFLD